MYTHTHNQSRTHIHTHTLIYTHSRAYSQTKPEAVKEESAQAYMLFYECRGIEYDRFLPAGMHTPAESEDGDPETREEGKKRDACSVM